MNGLTKLGGVNMSLLRMRFGRLDAAVSSEKDVFDALVRPGSRRAEPGRRLLMTALKSPSAGQHTAAMSVMISQESMTAA